MATALRCWISIREERTEIRRRRGEIEPSRRNLRSAMRCGATGLVTSRDDEAIRKFLAVRDLELEKREHFDETINPNPGVTEKFCFKTLIPRCLAPSYRVSKAAHACLAVLRWRHWSRDSKGREGELQVSDSDSNGGIGSIYPS